MLESGQYADSCEAVKEPCEYFFELSNEYEAEEFNIELEYKQREEIQGKFRNEIIEIQELYDVFREYFKQVMQERALKDKPI
ncbi:hypothetical protein [Paenibacillus pabuli]|uniref:hypothetical protein n=1 Tax=Paenibacillus pabuli TaxID=1472 RepID=UPI0020005951|nr:hypothetical protein [Paenibacillus pabuli]UPK45429.1 hypothetical protein KET34_08160 [Paenibacillus pabuli]